MITYHQITYTIPWLSCGQLPYPSEQPQISWIRQRDKSKIPLLISTYKYFLPQYSSSTSSFPILKFISPAEALMKSLRTSAVKKLSYGKALLESSNLQFFLLFRRIWPSTSLFLRLMHSHPLFLLLQSFTFCKFDKFIILNMWLDKFIFYGRSVGPTSIYLSVAERLANVNRFPLGWYLLGSIYHLLHQVAEKLLLGEPIGNLGGPWWFINMWLNAHMHKATLVGFLCTTVPMRYC